ncbi:hypothetical protein JCM14469_35450 [Desulfatiferula olefinivorans]
MISHQGLGPGQGRFLVAGFQGGQNLSGRDPVSFIDQPRFKGPGNPESQPGGGDLDVARDIDRAVVSVSKDRRAGQGKARDQDDGKDGNQTFFHGMSFICLKGSSPARENRYT